MLGCLATLAACDDDETEPIDENPLVVPESIVYTRENMVSDQSGVGAVSDPQLVNAWGIASGPDTALWVANNGTGTSTLYGPDGTPQLAGNPLVVDIPPPPGSTDDHGSPTGIVYNGGPGFVVDDNGVSGSALFLFATEQGTVAGWNGDVNPTSALIAVDNSSTGAIYKGLAIGALGTTQLDAAPLVLAGAQCTAGSRRVDGRCSPL